MHYKNVQLHLLLKPLVNVKINLEYNEIRLNISFGNFNKMGYH